MIGSISRRRAIAVIAAAAGLPVFLAARGVKASLVRWEGTALGASASIALYHDDEAAARDLIAECVAEVARLEGVFSLYRADSALSVLNRQGSLDAPPAELLALMGEALRFSELTGGSFDPTVQPLWRLYFGHFLKPDADPAGPDAAAVAQAAALVDWRKVAVDPGRIALEPGMAVTLNGIAQGWVTDRVSDLLRARGMNRVLVDMGEQRALGPRDDGKPWHVGVVDPRNAARVALALDVVDKAVATSGGYGTRIDAAGRFTHLFDPRSGRSADGLASVTVVAETAATADALSTALAVASPLERPAILARAGGGAIAHLVAHGGQISTIGG
ncbi:MAG: FAD:protein FMN transferase [Alphaproteobacteria bacterium]|nr:FAD:protein FMN transferase [Alphaproteobacteria bacterium]